MSAGRRSSGEGTVSRDRRTGLWVARLPAQYGRLSRSGFRTKGEAVDWIREQLSLAGQGRLPHGDRTPLAEYLEYWLRQVALSLRPKTMAVYRSVAQRYLVPALGEVPLRRLRPVDVQDLYTQLCNRGLADATVHQVHRVLHRALALGVRWGLLSRNPAELVEPPRRGRHRVAYWTPDQVRRFLEAVQGHRWHALYVLAAYTGARQGELLGLRWEDVDLARARLTVRRTAQWVGGVGLVISAPKTASGERSIPLVPTAVRALEELRQRRLLEGELPAGYVFATSTGRPLTGRNLVRHFRQVTVALGLPPIRFHDLRHTAATLCLAEGVPMRVVSELLGHADPSLTARVYAHVAPGLTEEAARALERALTGGKRRGLSATVSELRQVDHGADKPPPDVVS